MVERCETCRWWIRMARPDDQGKCRRYPPQLVTPAGMQVGTNSAFPWTQAADFCGEHAPREGRDDG